MASSAIAQPVLRHKALHLIHHHHHGRSHHHLDTELDIPDLDVKKTIQPILGSEHPSDAPPTAGELPGLSIAARPAAHDPK